MLGEVKLRPVLMQINKPCFEEPNPPRMSMSWEPDEETLAFIRHLALQNSLQYDGKGQAGSVISRIMGSRQELRQHGKIIAPMVAKEVAAANELSITKGLDHVRNILQNEAPEMLEKKEQKRREGLPELPNLNGRKPVLRFAPNPNGIFLLDTLGDWS